MTHRNNLSTDPSSFRYQAAACLHLPTRINRKPRPWFWIRILRLSLAFAAAVAASSQAQDFWVTPLVLASPGEVARTRASSTKGSYKSPDLVTLHWRTEGGTAVPGRDYLPDSGSVVVGGRRGTDIIFTILPSAAVGTSFGVRFSSDSSPDSSLVTVKIVPKVEFSAPQYHWQGGPFMEIPLVLSHPAPEDLSVIVDGISATVLKGNTNGTLRLGVDSLSWPASLRFSESEGIPGNGTYLIAPTASTEILPPGWDPGWTGISLSSLLINAAPGESPSLTVLHKGSVGQETRVRFETLDGTAVAGRDYEAQTGELVFRPYDSWKQISLPTFRNPQATQPRSFQIKVTALSKGLRVRNDRATVRIGEWDHIPRYAEGLEGHEVRVSLISPTFPNPIPPSRVVIKDRTARAKDYFAVTDMTVAAGTSELVLPVLDNPGVQGLRQVELEVSTSTAPFLTNHVLLSIVDNEVPNALDHAFLGPGDLAVGPLWRAWVRADDWIIVTWEVAPDRAEALLFTPNGALESRMMLPSGLLPWRDPHIAMPDGRWLFTKGDPAATHSLFTWRPGGSIEALDMDLPSGQISALHVAADGRIWVALSSSLLGPRLYELEASGRIRRRIELEDLIWAIREIQPDLIEADYNVSTLRIRNGLVESKSREPGGGIARDRLGRFIQTVSGPRSESGRLGRTTWFRYHSDGTLDESFFYGPTEGLLLIGTQSDGSVIAVGHNPDNTKRLLRLRANPLETTNRFSIGAATIGEYQETAVLHVARTGSTAGPAAVWLRTKDITARAGEDYEALDRVVEFAPLEVSKDVPIQLRRDALPEGPERFGVILEATGVPPVENMLYIWDDDPLLRLDLQSTSSGQIQATVTTLDTTVATWRLGDIHLQASSDLRAWRSIATNRWDYQVKTFITPDQEQQFFRAVMVNP